MNESASPWPKMTPEEIAAWQRARTAEALAKADEARTAHRRNRLVAILGERFATRTFATLQVTDDNREAYEVARSVVASGYRIGAGFYAVAHPEQGVTGNGNGKTHLAAAIANEAIGANLDVRFTTVDDLLKRVKGGYADHATRDEAERAIIAEYARANVVVLDDFGKEAVTDWSARTLLAIVNARNEQEKPIIATANVTLAELYAMYASPVDRNGRPRHDVDEKVVTALFDRLVECTSKWVEVRGESWRWK